jgi:N,N'-diacetyllegionaminate synthase
MPDTRLVEIGGASVGHGNPCLVIGEVAQTHDGSLGLAHAFVDAIADAGADAVKFQTHIAEAESTPSEPFRVPFSRQDASRYDYWSRTAFEEREWSGLAEHARERGLVFLSSPFSDAAFELLKRVGVPAWKVGSGEVINDALLERMARTRLPVLLSSGLSTLDELDRSVEILERFESPYVVLQATSAYPCPPELVGLNMLAVYHERYGCPVGLSDHSGTIYGSLAAVALGADVIEVHVALSREMFGPDVSSSITTDELRDLVRGIRFIEAAIQNPVDKDRVADELRPLRSAFTKSLVARVDLSTGTVIKEEHLTLKKPGTGLPAARRPDVVGRRLRRDLHADELLTDDHLE